MYLKYDFRKANTRVIIVSKAQQFQMDWHFPVSLGSLFTSVLKSLVHRWLVHESKVDSFFWLHQWQQSTLREHFHQACTVPFHLTNPSPQSWPQPGDDRCRLFSFCLRCILFLFGFTTVRNYILDHTSQYLQRRKKNNSKNGLYRYQKAYVTLKIHM